ncbi:MAG TPA: hypothetical protein VFW45_00790 [Candidatus Polarisedimenticolia bacterium]|nr:hypothetical protein [Candidatus Polarisedimenticolia bacterium]
MRLLPRLAALLLCALTFPQLFAQTQNPPPSNPPPPSVKDKLFFGGGLGLSFGDVDYVEVAPLIGYRFMPKLDGGMQLFYRWVNDSRYAEDINTDEYGATLFTRYFVLPSIFLEGAYEFINYEFVLPNFDTERDTANSFLAGGGYSAPIGRGAGFYFSALYNFNYDKNDLTSPYGDAWRMQAGVTVGF